MANMEWDAVAVLAETWVSDDLVARWAANMEWVKAVVCNQVAGLVRQPVDCSAVQAEAWAVVCNQVVKAVACNQVARAVVCNPVG